MDTILKKVKNTILNNSMIEKGEHIVIGLSGGPDSVCLFHVLYQLREELDIDLHAVHINHRFRPGAAEEDQNYTEALCAKFQVPCYSFTYDVNRIAAEEGLSSEEAGRQVRYRSFFEVAERIRKQNAGLEENGASKGIGGSAGTDRNVKVAVAHNLNDQAETVLFRILRGTGTDGLAGIEYLRTEKGKGVIIRPLLDVTREEIEAYCKENKLDPRIDLTNLEPVYTRNKIRLELIPYLKENFNSNIEGALSRLSHIAKEDKEYFGKRVDKIIAKYASYKETEQIGMSGNYTRTDRPVSPEHPAGVAVPIDILCSEHPAIRHRLIIKLFESIGLSKDIAAAHLEQADRLLQEKRTSSSSDFTAGYAMKISYDTIEFYKKTVCQTPDFEYGIDIQNEVIEIPELNAKIRVKILRRHEWQESGKKEQIIRNFNKNMEIINHKAVCRLNLDKIEADDRNLVLRSRRPGDYIVPLGMKGRKKLQDFFVDEKYPADERDRVPLLCMGPEVIWTVWPAGGRISENFKVDETAERIIILEYSAGI